MINRTYRTASDIYREIVGDPRLQDYTVVIIGTPGPTGKTTLCKLLISAGIKAIDISESLDSHVAYLYPNDNDIDIDWENKIVLVILNRLR